jgi:cellulose synthase/poly-beta-1,6-N-acetylglucosamine synthase-like glycosyltransferase
VLCYAYQFVFIIISYTAKKKNYPESTSQRLAVMVCARDEESVIGRIIDSLKLQSYPSDKFDVFVLADNCSDSTYDVAVRHGAKAYKRTDKSKIGKGYALDYLVRRIRADSGHDTYDAFLVFDADNTVDENYLTEACRLLGAGYDCITSYRCPSNYGDSWISAGQGMCFLRDTVLLNRARMAIGGVSFVSGTGFMFTRKLCDRLGGGWPFHTLTEDCEFTAWCATEGIRMGYCDSAVFYDEQPISFSESWHQRLRWSRGGIEVFRRYFHRLLRGLFSENFLASFDISLCMAPAYLISIAATVINTVGAIISLIITKDLVLTLTGVLSMLTGVYLGFLCFSIPLTVSEWKRLRARASKKILYIFTFPLFMLTFLPIVCVALVKKNVVWKKTQRKISENNP